MANKFRAPKKAGPSSNKKTGPGQDARDPKKGEPDKKGPGEAEKDPKNT